MLHILRGSWVFIGRVTIILTQMNLQEGAVEDVGVLVLVEGTLGLGFEGGKEISQPRDSSPRPFFECQGCEL